MVRRIVTDDALVFYGTANSDRRCPSFLFYCCCSIHRIATGDALVSSASVVVVVVAAAAAAARYAK